MSSSPAANASWRIFYISRNCCIAAETGQRLTPEGLRLWLRHQTQSGQSEEEHQLRLESDDDGVLIATIHKSKGLEYPVVFCPYLWKPGDNPKRSEILFHDPAAGKKITLDLRNKSEAAEHDLATGRERFEESLRMMYVALTRAQNLCYVYAGDIRNFDDSPLARIIGAQAARASLEMLAERSGGDDRSHDDRSGGGQVGGNLSFRRHESGGEIRAKSFHGSIPQTRMIASFSALISEGENEEADVDAVEIDEPDSADDATFAALSRFDRGVRTGLFWHDLLQNLDFQAPAAIAPLVMEKLVSHGFGNIQAEPVCSQVRNLADGAAAAGAFAGADSGGGPAGGGGVFVSHRVADARANARDFCEARPVRGFFAKPREIEFPPRGRFHARVYRSGLPFRRAVLHR